MSGELLETVIRAQRDGYPVLVAAADESSETVETAEELGATVVPVAEDEQDADDRLDALARAARDRGYPGAILHDAEKPIDLQGTHTRLRESNEYAIRSREEVDYDIIVGIPAYNEEIGIGSTIHAAHEYADKVIVVDDGSTDNTVPIATDAGAEVIEHEENKGKGGAVQTLFERVQDVSFDAFVLIDGDGQHLPQEITQVADPVREGDADMVIGSRYLEQDEEDETPAYRRFGQQVLDTLTLGSSSQELTDTQSGFRAFSPRAVEELELTTDGIGVESEMIDSAAQNDLVMEEVPIHVRYEGIDGQTYHPLHHGLTVVSFVLQLVRDRHPLLFFGVPGVLLMVAGALYGVDGILIYRATGQFYPAKALVSGFVTIVGTLGMFTGLVLNRVGNMVSD
ncbi:glycosyltransferase family 2 protein [Halarchaeum sp. P4]|uniref:glycosyltransferase family 2 protein n=1 Tax=Halarchaeum sp. P4 TaxID=3421639 RepID=UPI003EBE0186